MSNWDMKYERIRQELPYGAKTKQPQTKSWHLDYTRVMIPSWDRIWITSGQEVDHCGLRLIYLINWQYFYMYMEAYVFTPLPQKFNFFGAELQVPQGC